MVQVVVVAGADEASAKLLGWQEQELELLVEWWAARWDHDEARAALAELHFRRDQAVSRLLGGMTVRQRNWAQSHLTFANRPRDLAGRQLLLTWLQRREEVEACEGAWASRIDPANQRLWDAENRLQVLAGRAMAMWGRIGCSDMTGMPWQRVAAWARSQPLWPSRP